MEMQEVIKKIKEQGQKVSHWNKYGKDRYYICDNGYMENSGCYITAVKSDQDKYVFVEEESFIISGKKCYNGITSDSIEEMMKNVNFNVEMQI